MRKRFTVGLSTFGFVLMMALSSLVGHAGGILDHIKGEPAPPTLAQVARMIDRIQEDVLNQGTVVVKQPDVWSQARMTKFRKEFEDTMSPEVSKFQNYLSGRIARSDSASLQSQTALGASLAPGTAVPAPPNLNGADPGSAAAGATSTTATATTSFPATDAPAATFTLLNQTLAADVAKSGALTGLPLSLEPNIQLDEKADYINHLHRIRRVNLGDDNSDSAGYGLYLMRVPVSIQPGDKTVKGHGAIVNMTMAHEFGPRFLPATYRNLVINDVIDMLAPVVQELIRSGDAGKYHDALTENLEIEAGRDPKSGRVYGVEEKNRRLNQTREKYRKIEREIEVKGNFLPVSRTGFRSFAIAPSDIKRVFVAQNLLNLSYSAQQSLDLGKSKVPQTWKVNGSDVRSYLRAELESAYDLMEGRGKQLQPILQDDLYIEELADSVYNRKFEGEKGVQADGEKESNDFYNLYESFTHRIPGNLRYRPIGVLSWGIALEAGLLNRQLREDMRQIKGADGWISPPNVGELIFYSPEPTPEADQAFQGYIKARWPMITFALEPVTDQQNIEDSFTRRRDLQLAVAFALSSGRMSFSQAIKFTRQLQYEAQTIALNQTVSSFAHGSDTFGWRFTPRYQTPPQESNLRTVTNLLISGGPGPNYGLKNSKIEPGMRELTAVVVMPSFVRGMRLDVSSDWFRLHDPDEHKIHTARTVELGRRINEARAALDAACKCGRYRPEDTNRLRAKLLQIERMLPLQTQFVNVPYENTLGGFALFTQGVTALVPELAGFEGLEYIDPTKPNDILVFGKHFSIYEMSVVAGGKALPREGTGAAVLTDKDGKPVLTSNSLSPFRDPNNDQNVFLFKSDGSPISVADNGSYDIQSREVLRVRIPANVATSTREDKQKIVELYVSTPNGISNRLMIPVKPDTAQAAFATATEDPGFTFVDSSLTMPVAVQVKNSAVTIQKPAPLGQSARLRIQSIDRSKPLPAEIDVQFTFPVEVGTAKTVVMLKPILVPKVPLAGETYVIEGKALSDFTEALFGQLSANSLLNDTTVKLTSRPPLVRATTPDDNGAWSSTTNTLGVSFEPILTPPDPPAAGAPAKAAGGGGSLTSTNAPPRAAPASAAEAPANDAPLDDPMTRRVSLASTRPATRRVEPAVPKAQDALPAALPQKVEADLKKVESAASGGKLPPLPPQLTHSLIVMPGQTPSVNVSVPITNVMNPKRTHSLFRRNASSPGMPGGGPPPPIRGPLSERLFGRP